MKKRSSNSQTRKMSAWRSACRKSLAALAIIGCISTVGQTVSAQVREVVICDGPLNTRVTATALQPASQTKHLGNGPIDLNKLSPDILNCDVCRQRLGLPPLPEAGAISLGGLPLEVRQQFLRELNLPSCARIMSAQVATGEKSLPASDMPVHSENDPTPKDESSAEADANATPPVLPAPPPGPAPSVELELQSINATLKAQLEALMLVQQDMQDKAQASARELEETTNKVREEAEDRLAKMEASNQEMARMLEARTVEVSELQAAMKKKERELTQAKAKSSRKKKSPKKDD